MEAQNCLVFFSGSTEVLKSEKKERFDGAVHWSAVSYDTTGAGLIVTGSF